jgi:hypothetical protein
MWERVGWKAAVNGTGKHNWFVMHHEQKLYLRNSKGQIRRYGSYKAAQKVADKMNEMDNLINFLVWSTPMV